jgi:hypothetical protein
MKGKRYFLTILQRDETLKLQFQMMMFAGFQMSWRDRQHRCGLSASGLISN